jgi:hypothetical protein
MTEHIWKLLASGIQSVPNPPDWLRDLCRLTLDEVSRLPKPDDASLGQVSRPSVEEKVLAADYLDFLREQIRLGARGPEWNRILRERLSALEPFVGTKVLTGHFRKLPHTATLRLDPETGRPFYFEAD